MPSSFINLSSRNEQTEKIEKYQRYILDHLTQVTSKNFQRMWNHEEHSFTKNVLQLAYKLVKIGFYRTKDQV
jgi:hypothetical protein